MPFEVVPDAFAARAVQVIFQISDTSTLLSFHTLAIVMCAGIKQVHCFKMQGIFRDETLCRYRSLSRP